MKRIFITLNLCSLIVMTACGAGSSYSSESTSPSSSQEVSTTSPSTTEFITTTTTKEQCLVSQKYAEYRCYQVGETGPGGGIIFYVSTEGFLGATCSPICHFLEVSPAEMETEQPWCNNPSLFNEAVGLEIGYGESNTRIYEGICTSGAIRDVVTYESPNGTDDWFLPSRDELNELCKFARTQPTGDVDTPCVVNGYLQIGFSNKDYWSSSEIRADDSRFGHSARYQSFASGSNCCNTRKTATMRVRAIRMF